MDLNEKAIHARIYEWFYGNLPLDGCTYGWKWLLMLVLFFPCSIIGLPMIICEIFGARRSNAFNRVMTTVALAFLIFILIMLGAGIAILFWEFPEKSAFLSIGAGGIVFWLILILAFIIEGFKYIRDNNKNFFIIEYIKSVKEKRCIRINWVNNEERK